MTRKLIRPTANGDTLAGARHHSIFRNTSGWGGVVLLSFFTVVVGLLPRDDY